MSLILANALSQIGVLETTVVFYRRVNTGRRKHRRKRMHIKTLEVAGIIPAMKGMRNLKFIITDD